MLVTEAVAMGIQLFKAVGNAIDAESKDISESDLDVAVAAIDESEDRLRAAIERARAREAGDG